MQKKLIALAVAGLMSGAAFAQSNVTIYGLVDYGVTIDGKSFAGGNTNKMRLDSGIWGGNRLGFTGSEDLGGGLKAGFTIETGFNGDSSVGPNNASATPNFPTGGNNFMGRQAFMTLSGNFGTVAAGRQYSPAFAWILAPMDPFGAGTAGQLENLMNAGVRIGNPRFNNAMAYITPNMSGFQGVLAYAPGEVVGSSKNGTGRLFGGKYANGPLTVAFTNTSVNDAAGVSGGFLKLNTLGGQFDAGMAKLSFIYQTDKQGDGTAAGKTVDAKGYMLGATVKAGPGNVALSYTKLDDRLAANKDASQVGVGYFYPLSKRTTLYTAYATISNKNGATFTAGNATAAGTGQSGFNLAIQHKF